MRRYAFYLSVALLAFGIGSIAVFKLYWITKEKPTLKEETKILVEVQTEETKVTDEVQTEKQIGFGTGYGVRQLNDPEYVPNLHKATCNDKKLLPIWNELRKDKEFKEREKDFYQEADCSKSIEVQKIDLNCDRQKEFIIWGKNGNFCGGTGNCVLWIYEKKNDKYRQLLQSYAYQDGEEKWFEVERGRTKVYHNLLLKTHYSGYETIYRFYKFKGSRYVENKCLVYEYIINYKEPSVGTCKDYFEESQRR